MQTKSIQAKDLKVGDITYTHTNKASSDFGIVRRIKKLPKLRRLQVDTYVKRWGMCATTMTHKQVLEIVVDDHTINKVKRSLGS